MRHGHADHDFRQARTPNLRLNDRLSDFFPVRSDRLHRPFRSAIANPKLNHSCDSENEGPGPGCSRADSDSGNEHPRRLGWMFYSSRAVSDSSNSCLTKRCFPLFEITLLRADWCSPFARELCYVARRGFCAAATPLRTGLPGICCHITGRRCSSCLVR